MKKSNISFKKLAELSNVSTSTLSRYFNNGFVSRQKRKVISKNIDKYSFVRNKNASLIRGEHNDIIVLRTFVESRTQDNIITGISRLNNNKNILIKYCNKDETEFIQSLNQTLEMRPFSIIIFAPYNTTNEFEKALVNASIYAKIVVYDYESASASYVTVDYSDAFKQLAQNYNEIDFIYKNKNDVQSYRNRVSLLRKYFKKVNEFPAPRQSRVINIFQSGKERSKFQYENLKIANKSGIASISYTQPVDFDTVGEWIFVDQFLIGICLFKLANTPTIEQVTIKAMLVKKSIHVSDL